MASTGCSYTFFFKKSPPDRAVNMDFDFKVMKELKKFRPYVKKNLRITLGSFLDKTGQFKDSDRSRYSKALTQGGDDVLYHVLFVALGPRMVVDRDPKNLKLIRDEYTMNHRFSKSGKQIGLIQRGGPQGGITGSRFFLTGSIVYYHVDRVTGGGGVNIEGIGGHIRRVVANVGVELRLVDMSTSEILWSTLVKSWVSGTLIGGDLMRLITVKGDDVLISAELGMAQQLPADYAFQICVATAIENMIRENPSVFLSRPLSDSLMRESS
jgi:curli biogenesis system outer membrane secretion channel CsgG